MGMDIDSAGLANYGVERSACEPETLDEIKEVVSATRLPFILKVS